MNRVAVKIVDVISGEGHEAKTLPFAFNERVEKWTGDYQLPGRVRGYIVTEKGKILYAVEHNGGFVHIYSEANLRALSEEQEPE